MFLVYDTQTSNKWTGKIFRLFLSVIFYNLLKMLFTVLTFCFYVADGLPFLPVSDLNDCPNIPVQEDVKIEQISGSWRLAYLFLDEPDQLEDDGSCIVTEFTPITGNRMDIAVHMDFRQTEFIIERSSFDLMASYQTPGQWMLHSNSSHKSFLHVKVISLNKNHMILTFCISNATATNDHIDAHNWGYNYIVHKLRKEGVPKFISKDLKFGGEDATNSELNDIFGRKSYFRRKRNWMDDFGGNIGDSDLFDTKHNHIPDKVKHSDKHFWTAVLVKDNNVSAYKFLENASILIKLGFDIRKGNLVSFGPCYF